MTIRQHLQKVHEHEADKCTKLAGECKTLHECFSGMSKAAGGEDGEMYSKIASTFHAMHKIHADSADRHAGFSSECEKAHEDALGKTLVPDRFGALSIVDTPEVAFSGGVRAVPRHGAPMPHQLDKTVRDRVPLELQYIVGSDGDE